MNKPFIKYSFIFILIVLLISIRFFEKNLFDDGLIQFFTHDYLTQDLPITSSLQTIIIDGVRFWINSILSIMIMFLVFKQKHLLTFLLSFYGLVFLIIIIALHFAIANYTPGHYLSLFYIRRFLIQPLLLFILVPALLFQKKVAK